MYSSYLFLVLPLSCQPDPKTILQSVTRSAKHNECHENIARDRSLCLSWAPVLACCVILGYVHPTRLYLTLDLLP